MVGHEAVGQDAELVVFRVTLEQVQVDPTESSLTKMSRRWLPRWVMWCGNPTATTLGIRAMLAT
jgi:hypothetical protein